MGLRSPGRRRRNGRAAVRRLEDRIRRALQVGETVVSIYEAHSAELMMSYSQFARHVQRLRRAHQGLSAVSAAVTKAAPGLVGMPAEGPPRGQPEETASALNLDRFAAQGLTKKDLI